VVADAAVAGARHGEYHRADARQRAGSGPGQWRRRAGVHLEHGQVAVHVLAEQLAALRAVRRRRRTVAPSPWTLWAFVRTRFAATTTPLPRCQCPPMPTTAGEAFSATAATAC
jgi:hypothetical protein